MQFYPKRDGVNLSHSGAPPGWCQRKTSNRGLLLEQGRLLLASAEEDPDALKKWLASIEVAGLVTVSWGGFVLSWLGLVGVFFFFSSWLGWVGLFGFGKHPSIFWSHVFYLFFSCYIAAFQTNRGPDFLSLSLKTCGVCGVCLQIRNNAGISSQRVARVGCKSGPLEASRKVTRTAKSVDLDEFLVEQWSNEVANNDGKRDMTALQGFP